MREVAKGDRRIFARTQTRHIFQIPIYAGAVFLPKQGDKTSIQVLPHLMSSVDYGIKSYGDEMHPYN